MVGSRCVMARSVIVFRYMCVNVLPYTTIACARLFLKDAIARSSSPALESPTTTTWG